MTSYSCVRKGGDTESSPGEGHLKSSGQALHQWAGEVGEAANLWNSDIIYDNVHAIKRGYKNTALVV